MVSNVVTEAVDAESDTWIESHKHMRDARGRRQVVRNGFLLKRSIITGVGRVEVGQPRVLRCHSIIALDAQGRPVERFRSKILLPCSDSGILSCHNRSAPILWLMAGSPDPGSLRRL